MLTSHIHFAKSTSVKRNMSICEINVSWPCCPNDAISYFRSCVTTSSHQSSSVSRTSALSRTVPEWNECRHLSVNQSWPKYFRDEGRSRALLSTRLVSGERSSCLACKKQKRKEKKRLCQLVCFQQVDKVIIPTAFKRLILNIFNENYSIFDYSVFCEKRLKFHYYT